MVKPRMPKKMGRRDFIAGLAAAAVTFVAGGAIGRRLFPQAATHSVSVVSASLPPPWTNVVDFGADPTGKSDSSEAFIRALTHIEQSAASNPAHETLGNDTARGRVKLYVPEGCYLLSKPEALMRHSYHSKTLGLVIQGAGRGLTQIYYRNSKAGEYLLYNKDTWLFISISDIEFISDDVNNNFMYSYSEGSAQNYTFERCMWSGSWNYVFHLEGTNTNSEMTWFHCNFSGVIRAGIYVPADGGSDQFLNYNFYSCQFEVEEGNYLVFEKGGNINIWGGSIIHYDRDKGGTFFKLMNGGHFGGVERFLCIGARFEHRNKNSKLIECEWNDGAVSFISCDMSSQAFQLAPAIHATFRSINQKMPSITFQSCVLMGKHEFRYLSRSWESPHNIVYESCEFAHGLMADEFIVYTNDESSLPDYKGGRPQVIFRNCRSIHATHETGFYDSDLGFQSNNRAVLTKKLISIRNAFGALPHNGEAESFQLPLGAIILNVKFIGKPDAVTSEAAADYWIETSEQVPARIAAVYAEQASRGFQANIDPVFECNTDAKRKLRLCSGSKVDEPNGGAYCLIEYIG
ncbi:glycoside hydrolase family 55 protein [Cohnella silvisoli]|uniref:Glycoside hydrolase family 55 protein n=1 Tax=Cohnella silvisoli TaxID=2873699 RepID=A0ABV1KVY0_9BACL|nr:glycoside hydrolase family 55 protein [Cohnella silvisoli]MCD9023652.1 glycoside hydrolase family 55 protein [Cohnella silvisoli]